MLIEEKDELYHHGVLGMKWGVRRYQNKDGSLTSAGKKRVDKMKSEYTQLTGKQLRRSPTKNVETKTVSTKKKKSIRDMTDEELRENAKKYRDRYQLEKNYVDAKRDYDSMVPKKESKMDKFKKTLINDVAIPAAKEAGKKALTNYLTAKIQDILGVKVSKERGAELTSSASQRKKQAAEALEKAAQEARSQRKAENKVKRDAKKESRQKEKEWANKQKQAEKMFEDLRNEHKKDSTNSSQNNSENKNKSSKSNSNSETFKFNATANDIFGEGNSKFSGWKDGSTVNGKFRDVPVTDTSLTVYKKTGQNYISGLLEYKR